MCLIFYTDWIPNADMQYQLGWVLILIVFICFICNLMLILKIGSRSIYLLAIKYTRVIERKLNWDKKPAKKV